MAGEIAWSLVIPFLLVLNIFSFWQDNHTARFVADINQYKGFFNPLSRMIFYWKVLDNPPPKTGVEVSGHMHNGKTTPLSLQQVCVQWGTCKAGFLPKWLIFKVILLCNIKVSSVARETKSQLFALGWCDMRPLKPWLCIRGLQFSCFVFCPSSWPWPPVRLSQLGLAAQDIMRS